jgi:TolB protein
VDADGKNEKRLTQSPSIEANPTFGPDGRIYFVSDGLNGQDETQVFSMRSDGSQVLQVTNGDAMPARPAVSPDGRLLAFVSDDEDGANIYTVPLSQGRAVGTPRRLTQGGTANLDPSFSRDSRFILFASNRSGNFDIYRTSLDGSVVQALVTHPATDRAPRAL